MRTVLPLLVAALWSFAPGASAQPSTFDRLPSDVLDVVPPSDWVHGVPGQMTVQTGECRDFPRNEVRRRIVDIAVQEWGFFGFPVLDRAEDTRLLPPGSASSPDNPTFEPASSRRPPALNREESERVAASIAGYWAVTRDGPWILEEQNGAWSGPRGVGVRWRSPWSAVFISWVMCEAGLGTSNQFQRAIAHHTYIDQAIRARDGQATGAAFVAHDIGEAAVEPGDLLCAGRRPVYRTVAERRRQMGTGASTHCDIVVMVDEPGERILAIGGNVLRSVSLKVLPAALASEGDLRPVATSNRPPFAHLKLQADPVEPDALVRTPTFEVFSCLDASPPARTALVMSAFVGSPSPPRRC